MMRTRNIKATMQMMNIARLMFERMRHAKRSVQVRARKRVTQKVRMMPMNGEQMRKVLSLGTLVVFREP